MAVTDPHANARHRVLDRVFKGSGESEPSERQAAANGRGVSSDLQPLIDKIHRHAYKVTDADIAAAQAKYGDDKMFEMVVSAALGAANQRLQAGLKALNEV
ncbi:MAG TPA: hypothetical protein VJ840_09070 [Gemmatimonadaceae bacterium]|nr:hypothetical protein [Gemmatimonadaceae bacterium]